METTDSAAAFVHRLTEKRDLSVTMFLVDGYGYLLPHLIRIEWSTRLCRTEPDQKVV